MLRALLAVEHAFMREHLADNSRAPRR